MPASLGSLRPGAAFAYFVEITNRSRSAATRRIASGSRSEEHTSELQSLMRISYAVFCLKKKKKKTDIKTNTNRTTPQTNTRHTIGTHMPPSSYTNNNTDNKR